jgi:transporter family protein
MSDLAIAVLAGLGGMLGWGAADFFAKKTIDQIGDLTTLFWAQAVGVIPLLGIFVVTRDVPTLHRYDVLWLVLFGIVSALSYLPVYVAFGKGQVSLISPIFASYAALVVVLSACFFGEHISTGQWVAIAVVFLGVLLISTDPSDLGRILRRGGAERIAGVPEVVGALVAYSFWLVLLDNFIGDRDWVFFLLVIRASATVTLYVYARVTRRPLALVNEQRSLVPFVILIGCADVAAFSAVSYGFSATPNTSVVAVLSSTFSLPTLILARIFLKEHLGTTQKLAAGIILGGIVLVTVY